IPQGLNHADDSTINFGFVGDSTFFASGITGVVNAVYNRADVIFCILDNSTTAMTGHQPHPGMGITMMGEKVKPVDISKVLEGCGVEFIRTVDPLDYRKSIKVVREAMKAEGVRAIIFKSPCIALVKPNEPKTVDPEECAACLFCVNKLGCPALIPESNPQGKENPKAFIDKALCTGCGLCAQICPVKAIK
ncbi:MAG: 4Fe-4S binding protein, partial [Firmicutes bacterium]|nr:4Fe-4S binding protein [Bacillota bacterium]